MQEIKNNGQAHLAKSHPSENSRRPGTTGHPGKHLGHFKAQIKADPANASLFEQQIKSLKAEPKSKPSEKAQDTEKPEQSTSVNTETTAEKVAQSGRGQTHSEKSATGQKSDDRTFDIQLNHLQDTGDAFAEQIAFTSRMHAISTAFF